METGDFHVTTIGDNLPNENEIREKYGSKSFLFTAECARARSRRSGIRPSMNSPLRPQEIERDKKYGREAEDLLTAMHEVIGHGSGKLSPKLTHDPRFI